MLALYFRLIGARIRSQMQYRLSFMLDLLGTAGSTGMEFVVLVVLLQRFDSVGGWRLAEIGVLYGITSVSFGMAEMIARGFDSPFERMMQRGAFDSLLIRPLGSFFQVMTSEFQLRRLGRSAQGAAVLAYAFANTSIAWTPTLLTLLVINIISGTVIYIGLVVIGATICFWTIKTPEVINVFTFGGQQLTSLPLSIYNRWVRAVFLSIVPVAFASYPMALLLLGRTDPHGVPAMLAWAAPLAAAIFFSVAWLFWRFGERKYQSTGT